MIDFLDNALTFITYGGATVTLILCGITLYRHKKKQKAGTE